MKLKKNMNQQDYQKAMLKVDRVLGACLDGLGHEDLQRHFGDCITALLLQQQVPHLGAVAVGDDDAMGL